MGCKYRVGLAPDAGGAVEVEEAAGAKVHPLLALAVVVQAELLRLRMCAPPRCQRTSNVVKTRRPCGDLTGTTPNKLLTNQQHGRFAMTSGREDPTTMGVIQAVDIQGLAPW